MKLYKHRQSISLFLAFVLCLSLSPRQALAASTGEGDAAAAVELPLPGEQAAPAAAAPAQDELRHEPAAAGQPGEPGEPDGNKEPAGNVEDENGSEKLNENEDETIVYACAEGTDFALLCVGGKGLIYDAQAQQAVARAAEGLSLSEGTELKHCTVGPEGALSAVLGESLLIVGRVFTAQELPAAQAELEAYLAAGVQGEPTGEPPVEQPGQGEAPAGQPDEGEPAGEPTPMPAVDFPVQTVDGMTVTVSAPEGAFPAGVTMSVSAVEDEEILAAMAEAAAVGLGAVQAVDIVFLSAEGEELQPALPIRVSIVSAAIVGADGAAVVHVDGEGQAAVVSQLDEESAEDEVLFEAEAFSPYGVAAIYSVDFYYIDTNGETSEHHLPGGSSMLLSELLAALGITRDVQDITALDFTNESLVSFTPEGGDYRVSSLRPFLSTERLTLSFADGESILITVKDPLASGTMGQVSWYISDGTDGDNSGTLVIKPTNGVSGNFPYPTDLSSEGSNKESYWGWHGYRSQITAVRVEGTVGFASFSSGNAAPYNFMFQDCKNMTSADLSGLDTTGVSALARMFSGCSALAELDLSMLKNNGTISNMQNMFNGCTNLRKLEFNGTEFETRPASATNPNGNALINGLNGMFTGCNQLQYVDMSNLKLHLRQNDTSLKAQFTGKSNLQTLLMNNTVIDGVQDLRGAFSNCPSLTNVQMTQMTGDGVFPDAVTMENLFASSFTNPQAAAKVGGKALLDVSGFGVLEHIVRMDGFVSGCTGLQTLNIDNLDNSRIKPTNRNHPASDTDPGAASVNTDWGRMLGVETCTALETLSAKNSKVWMVARNSRGKPGEEYYDASDASAIYYFTNKQMEFKSDVGPTVIIDSDRDWIDLITDRDGTNMPTLNAGSFPDSGTNINWSNGDLNRNGAGFLAPGVYTLGSDGRSDPGGTSFPDTYYRVAYIGEVPYEVYVNDTLVENRPETVDGLVVVQTGNNTWVSTTARSDWPSSGSETIDTKIKFVYKDAAIDVNGKKHNVAITVDSITFKDLGLVPTDPGRTDDPNNYYDTAGGGTYYRSVLQATRDKGVIFRNGLYISDPASPWENSAVKALSGGSGMDVSFKVEIERALPGTHFVFYVDDLDVEKSQSWIQETSDWCDDKLPVGNKTYGTGGESFELGSGNGNASFAPHTGLVQVGSTVITTGSDPSTSWSEFTVKAEATGANYTWKSGVSCSTQAMKNTPKLYLGELDLNILARKAMKPSVFTPQDGQFNFKLEYVGVTPDGAPAPVGALPKSASNTGTSVSFGSLVFKNPGDGSTSSLIYQDPSAGGGDKYFPGTSPTNNSEGQGTHNTFTYTFKAYEIPGSDALITYDPHQSTGSAYTVEVKLYTPESEAEMRQGIKYEVYVDGAMKNSGWSGTAPVPVGASLTPSAVSTDPGALPFTNEIECADLQINKKQQGSNESETFTYDVVFTIDPSKPYQVQWAQAKWSAPPYVETVTVTTANGKGSAVIADIPRGVGYTVKERDKDGWRLVESDGTSGVILNGVGGYYLVNGTVIHQDSGGSWVNEDGNAVTLPLPQYLIGYHAATGALLSYDDAQNQYKLADGSVYSGAVYRTSYTPLTPGEPLTPVERNGYLGYAPQRISVVRGGGSPPSLDRMPFQVVGKQIHVANFKNEPVLSLAIEKQVKGNQASRDKFFKFEVTISNLPQDTVLELDTSRLVLNPSRNAATSYGAGDMANDNGRDDMPSLTYGSASSQQRVDNVWTDEEGYTYVYDVAGEYNKYDSNGNSVGSVSEPPDDATCGIPGQQIVADSSGEVKLTVYLQHGNELILKGIPYGAAYEVKEVPEDYLPELMLGPIDKSDPPKTYDDKTDETGGGGSGTPIFAGPGIYETGDTFFREDTKLTFTNHRNGIIPTGMDTEMRGPMLLAMTGALALLTLGYLGRRRRRHGPA